MNKVSDIEKEIIESQWEFDMDDHRRKSLLCPNCLVERSGEFPKPHANWCAIARRIREAESNQKNSAPIEEATKTLTEINDAVRDLASRFIGSSKSSRTTMHDLVFNYLQELRSLENSKTVVKSNIAWDCMTLWEKCKWFLANRMIKSIGEEARKWHGMAVGATYVAESNNIPVGDIPTLPHWLLDDPWNVIVLDVAFTPVMPVNRIDVSFSVPEI
jgi:hypothetical protein